MVRDKETPMALPRHDEEEEEYNSRINPVANNMGAKFEDMLERFRETNFFIVDCPGIGDAASRGDEVQRTLLDMLEAPKYGMKVRSNHLSGSPLSLPLNVCLLFSRTCDVFRCSSCLHRKFLRGMFFLTRFFSFSCVLCLTERHGPSDVSDRELL